MVSCPFLLILFSIVNHYPGAPARFGAGTGFGGAKTTPGDSRAGSSGITRHDSSPGRIGGANDADNLPSAAARAAEHVNGSHVASAISTVQTPRALPVPGSQLQPSRTAPSRPLLTTNRPAPPAPTSNNLPFGKGDITPDLRARQKPQGPTTPAVPAKDQSQSKQDQWEQQRLQDQKLQEERWQLEQEERARQIREQQSVSSAAAAPSSSQAQQSSSAAAPSSRPPLAPSKSTPAATNAASQAIGGPAGSTVGPPPVMPLQPAKKFQIQHQEKPTKPAVAGGVAAAAAALEKPKEKEKRISTMTEVQIMEKLRQVVSEEDPKQLYSKIRKVGQG